MNEKMKNFTSETTKILDDLMEKSSEAYDKGEVELSKQYLIQAYKSIPNPKEEYDESYNYCSYIITFIINENTKKDDLQQWLNELVKISVHQDCWKGDVDFFQGKAYFIMGKYQDAWKHFDDCIKIANSYRYFESEDPRYIDFYRHPEKYIKES